MRESMVGGKRLPLKHNHGPNQKKGQTGRTERWLWAVLGASIVSTPLAAGIQQIAGLRLRRQPLLGLVSMRYPATSIVLDSNQGIGC